MRPRSALTLASISMVLILFLALRSLAQAPPSIQIFMPDGSLPQREVRFTLTNDTGRVDTFFTDSKGKFLLTRGEGLRPDAAYTITITGDGQTFDTTVVSFKHYGVYYVPIFLRPLIAEATRPAGVINLAELDLRAPQEARDEYDSGMRALKAGHVQESLNHLNKALTIYPEYFRALNDLGVVNMKLNRMDEAAKAFEKAISIAPRVFYPRLNLAIIRTRQSKYKEAVELLEQLYKENPPLVEIRVALGDALMAAGRLDQAETHLRAALSDDKLDGDALGNARYLLGLLLNRKQRFDEAVKELTTAVKILPGAARVHLQLGAALKQLQRLDEAERHLLAAYRLGGPEMGAAQFWLGELYFMQKKYADSMKAFEKYLADVPTAPNAAQVRSVIEKIKAALDQK